MADIDGDGDLDLLYGDDIGNVRLYLRDEDGELSFEGNIEADGEEIDVDNRAAPEWVDWDLDGDFDLLVGSSEGVIYLFINTGSDEQYEFTFEETLEETLEEFSREIDLRTDTAPAFGDLDGDGTRDLVVGSVVGELWFFPNIGEDDDPEFGEGVKLADEDGEISLGYAYYTRPELVDWEGDGDLDLVTGIADPEVWLYINPTNESVASETKSPPVEFKIEANYPEPFNHSTSLKFRCIRSEILYLDVLDISGKTLKTVNLGMVEPGQHTLSLDLSGFTCGRYIVNLSSVDHSASRIVTLLK